MPLKHLNLRAFLTIAVILAVVIWVLLLILSGFRVNQLNINWDAVKHIPTVLSIEGVLWFLFAKWFWRSRMFQGWLVPFPDLQGTWKGSLQSAWKNPGENEPVAAIPIHLIVRHSFLNVSCTLMTQESKSHSYSASLCIDAETGVKRLIYTYNNKPLVAVRDRSEIHDGTASLEISKTRNGMTLKGEYWTNRLSRGDMSLTYVSPSIEETAESSSDTSKIKKLKSPSIS